MDAELAGSHPPTSRCPRLHALAILPGPSPTPAPAPLPPSAIAEARLRTIGLLSLVLGGDDLAAEYLLLQLVGRWVLARGRVTSVAPARGLSHGRDRMASLLNGSSFSPPPKPSTPNPPASVYTGCMRGGRMPASLARAPST